jgi:hypothetical protein
LSILWRSTHSLIFKASRKAIKKLSPQQFPGEDITLYCTTVQEMAKPLLHARQYPQDLTDHVIMGLLTAGGDATHQARFDSMER